MDKLLLFLISLILVTGCMLEPRNNRLVSSQSGGDDSSDNSYDITNIYWYTNQVINGTITLNESSQDILYLQGAAANGFLSYDGDDSDAESLVNFYDSNGNTKVYCLIVNYNDPSTKKQLRFRAMPLTLGSTRYFRIDVPDSIANEAFCQGSVDRTLNVVGTPISDTIDTVSEIGYSLDDLCPTCSSTFISAKVELYESINGIISNSSLVDSEDIDFSSLSLRVDTQSSSTSNVSSCSNSECISRGYDCCLEGQCVNDAEVKPNASSEDNYLQALASVASNHFNYILYPNIYYVCGNLPPTNPTPTPTPDVQATADTFLANNIAEYNCLQGAAESTPDYSDCSPDNNYASYITIRDDVWTRCGCAADPDDPAPFDPENACPDFGLKPIYDTDNTTILEIVCDIPQPDLGPTPFEDTWVTVTARNAPHRFFDSTGASHDRLEDLTDDTIEQELYPFSYGDNLNKTEPVMDPQDVPYNINAIHGSMKIDLSSTLPAQVIDVDFESPYIITSTTGSYLTLCSSCAPDQWIATLSAYPPARDGLGLSAVGYTTSRSLVGTNTSRGNYEDTLFGRACWVPPAMIPFSHQTYSTAVGQRQRRLETQAALYVNGYQRDWFGFNKGAVIGSFDGVSWFAVGQGRRVVSTSTKLFLAINTPFNDLAEVASVKVTVVNDQGYNGATNYDYDTGLDINDNQQNLGATCQKYHICEKDLDCVTQLGWEYTCADVSKYKTNWPRFDLYANELANDQHEAAKFTNARTIIQNFSYSAGTKRCIYRGAGAPCAKDYDAISDNNVKKLFTCAPNFFCAGVDTDNFNNELVRAPNLLESILLGQDADVLGRPKHYATASDSLSSTVQSNLQANATAQGIATTNIGICRPGRDTQANSDLARHQSKDGQGRTDYISQIAPCDSSAITDLRVRSCPTFNLDEESDDYGNYTFPSSADITQNSCGASSVSNSSTSTFRDVEAERLSILTELMIPKVAQDACLKKAGTPCHTDLDCGPNRLHAEQALFYSAEDFGDTLAEQDYWSQELICGQASSEPSIQSEGYFDFDMTQNRCCREIGKDFTMYTQGYGDVLSDPENVSENLTLDVTSFPSEGNMAADGRYSRYEVAEPVVTSVSNVNTPVNAAPIVSNSSVPQPYQWRTLNTTGRRTCCGGGWVRKFVDGGHDWNIRNRNQFIISSFKCLNYSTNLGYLDDPQGEAGINPNNYDRDLDRLCLSPIDEDQITLFPEESFGGVDASYTNNQLERKGPGCIHAEMKEVEKFEIILPTSYSPLSSGADHTNGNYAILDTMLFWDDDTSRYINHLSPTVPYMPVPYGDSNLMFKAGDQPTQVNFYLPLYIAAANIHEYVYLRRWTNNGEEDNMDSGDTFDNNQFLRRQASCAGLATGQWCIDSSSGYDVFKAVYIGRAAGMPAVGLQLRFTPYRKDFADDTVPGNVMYYQTKLARFELLGIPQIFYEPIYCNDDNRNLVPNIFDEDITDETAFINNSYSYEASAISSSNGRKRTYLEQIYDQESTLGAPITNSGQRITTQENVALAQVFSPNEFTCCNELGDEVTSADQCCSSYAAENNDGVLVCKLSRGTDLNVYFNRFVSGDGTGSDQPGGGLDDDDFIPETGEIKLTTEAYDKLVNLGGEYCENGKVRTGGAFGNFYPGTSFIHYLDSYDGDDRLRKLSIIDSFNDYDDTGSTTRGAYDFQIGFRWNHHYYCD